MRTEYNDLNSLPSSWVVVNTHPHGENRAVENLSRQGFPTYCPQLRRQIKTRYGPKDALRPLFPNYVFVEVARDLHLWRPILSTYGVRNLIRFGDQVSFVDSEFIDALREREIDGAIVKPEIPYELGQDVRISGGPFNGIIAKIVEINETDRLVVLISLLNQLVRTTVSTERLTPYALS